MNRVFSYTLDTGDDTILNSFPRGLMTKEEIEMVQFIKQYKMTYGNIPTLDEFKTKFPTFVYIDPGDKRSLLAGEIKRRKIFEINRIINSIDPTNIEESFERISTLRDKLSLGPSSNYNIKEIERDKLYQSSNENVFVISEEFTNEVGLRRGEVLTVVGKYASAKSILTENSAVEWLLDGERVLIISNDMSSKATLMRVDSFTFHIDVTELDKHEFNILNKVQRIFNDVGILKGEIIVPSKSVRSSDEIAAMTKELGATVLLVDGAYLVRPTGKTSGSSREWTSLSEVTGDMVSLAHELNIPIVLVSQANRDGDVAFSNSFAQDSDIVVKLEEVDLDFEEDNAKVVNVKTMKNRRGKPFDGNILIDFSTWTVSDMRGKK